MPFVHAHAPQVVPSPTDLALVIQAERLLARGEVDERVTLPAMADVSSQLGPTIRPLHIGVLDDRRCWLWVVEGEQPAPPGWEWHDTRALLPVLSDAQGNAINCARQLMWWERRHRYCGMCGTATNDAVEERARRCPKCGALYFPVVSPAIIVAVTRGDELLLAHNRNFRPGLFSLLAGFVDPGETLEQATVREVREEVGLEIADLQYVASQPWPFPNSLMVGFRARHVRGDISVDGKEIEEAHWYRRSDLPDIPRPGTVARRLIEDWLQAKGQGTDSALLPPGSGF